MMLSLKEEGTSPFPASGPSNIGLYVTNYLSNYAGTMHKTNHIPFAFMLSSMSFQEYVGISDINPHTATLQTRA